MRHCKHCEQVIDHDPGSDLWRGRDNGKLECRAHTQRGLYRHLHMPKTLREADSNKAGDLLISFVEVDD